MAGRVVAFLRLGRPWFLPGPALLFAYGAMTAGAPIQDFDRPRVALGFAFVALTQLMVHYANDYWDLAADRANLRPSWWAGGSRVLAAGALPPASAQVAAWVLGAASLVVGTAWAWEARSALLALLAAATWLLSWAYSAPPVRLAARGAGAVGAALVVGALVPLLGAVAAGGTTTMVVIMMVAPFPLHVFALILVLDLPDRDGDAAAGKRTLAVRLDAKAYAWLVRATFLATLLATAAGLAESRALAFGLGLGLLPGAVVAAGVRRFVNAARWNLLESLALAAVGLATVGGLAALALR